MAEQGTEQVAVDHGAPPASEDQARVPPRPPADRTLLAPFRRRVLQVAVLIRLLVVASMAVALLSQDSVDLRVAALVALATANVGYLISRVPWHELLERPTGVRWLYTWSVLDIFLITLGIAHTGGASSELFVLYALAVVLYAATYPPRGQAVLLASMVAGYLAVVAFDGWDTSLAASAGWGWWPTWPASCRGSCWARRGPTVKPAPSRSRAPRCSPGWPRPPAR
jgi:hypothetical protein